MVERRLLRSCQAAVTVSEPLAEELRVAWSLPSHVVMNGYAPSDRSDEEQTNEDSRGFSPEPLRVVFTGALYPGKRDPAPLLEAVRLLAARGMAPQVEFYGPSAGQLSTVVDPSLSAWVQLKGSVGRSEALRLQRGADVLLLLMWNHPGERGVYSGKIFEYLSARRPILMLGYPDGVAADLIRSREAGIVANTPEQIAAALERWIDEKGRHGRVQALPLSAAEGLTRMDAARRLRDVLQRVAEAPPRRA